MDKSKPTNKYQRYQDALNEINHYLNLGKEEVSISSCNTAMEALAKMIPRTPLRDENDLTIRCPYCMENKLKGKEAICPRCHQLLDWSEFPKTMRFAIQIRKK